MADKKIGGRTFQVGEVLATESIRLQVRLLKIIGGGVDRLPQIMAGVGSPEGSEAKEKANGAAVAALADMFGKADPDQITQLISDIASLATIKRPSGAFEQVDVDGDFTSHKADLLPFLTWVLREVLGDFFGGLGGPGGLSKLMAQA